MTATVRRKVDSNGIGPALVPGRQSRIHQDHPLRIQERLLMSIDLIAVFSSIPGEASSLAATARQRNRNFAESRGGKVWSFSGDHFQIHAHCDGWETVSETNDQRTADQASLFGRAMVGDQTIDASRLLQLWRREGNPALAGVSGRFCLLHWDGMSHNLRIATDRQGFFRLYVWEDGQRLIVATHTELITALPFTPWRIDPIGVAQYLTTGHLLEDRTLITGIRRFPAGEIWAASPTDTRKERYWQLRMQPDPTIGSRDLVPLLFETINKAIVRQFSTGSPEPAPLLPVTGGFDSRVLAGCLHHQGIAPECVTYGHRHCHDVRYGRRIAKAIGAAHEYLPLADDFFKLDLELGLHICSGEITIDALPMLRLNQAGSPGQLCITGFLGDVLSGGWLFDYEDLDSDATRFDLLWQRRYISKGFSPDQLQHVLVPTMHSTIEGSVITAVRRILDGVDADTFSERSIIAEINHRQRRYTSYHLDTLGQRFAVAAPFTDNAVVDLWSHIPLAAKSGQHVYIEMICAMLPRLAAIPDAKHGVKLDQLLTAPPSATERIGKDSAFNRPGWLDWRLRALQRSAGKLLTNMSGGWLGPHDRSQYAHHDESIRRTAPEWFRAKLDRPELTDGWFKHEVLLQMLDEHLERKIDHSIRLNNIITFLEWRQMNGL